MKVEFPIPREIEKITNTLESKGFLAYLVGGCVRDLALNKKPKDWDITTNAKPEEIVEMFPKTVYENDFGTVMVINEEIKDQSLRQVEITPFRLESKYSDKRRPDTVSFSDNIEDDLKRRDFTINAMAYSKSSGELIDLFSGMADLKDHQIKAVGKPEDRFEEDPLRIMRGIRLATEIGFTINIDTEKAMEDKAELLNHISKERIQEEFKRLVMSDRPMLGLQLMEKNHILQYILPELRESIGVEQKGDHIYDVWEHSLRALQHSADRDFPLHIRLSALFHDIGKPATRRWDKAKNKFTFYGHEVVGAKITNKILKNLKFSSEITETVTKLVRYHMFFTDIEQISLSAVRRIIRNVGDDLVWDLMKLRACDRIGMGRPKEDPYRLRKYESMIEEAMRAPTSVKMLKVDGNSLMKELDVKPGPKIGYILHALLEEVLEDPQLNSEEYLLKKAKKLNSLPDKQLIELANEGKEKMAEIEEKELNKIKKRHRVQ